MNLHYDVLAELKRVLYKDLLTIEHLIPYKIEIKKMNLPNGSSDEEYNFRGWEFQKNNVRYLVSDTLDDKKIQIRDILPILPKDALELGSKGNVYLHVKNPISMKFKALKSISFRDLVHQVSSLKHSNQEHHILMHLIAFASTFFRTNIRIASNPAFGKDSIVEIHNGLIDKCGTIESPTLAKLEERSTVLTWLAISEVVDITPGEWRIIQQYLLAAAAHKPEITKHSRAHGSVGEVIDLSKLSISLIYNDIQDYPDPETYFDFVTKSAVKSRFPALRFYGEYTEDFNELVNIDISKYIKDNIDKFKDIIYNYTYYMKNYTSYIHKYSTSILESTSSRDKTNLGRVLKVLDMYCESQEEFNKYVGIIENCIKDYQDMLKYPDYVKGYYRKLNIPESTYTKFKIPFNLDYLLSYFYTTKDKVPNLEHKISYTRRILEAKTFTEKNILLKDYKDKKTTVDEKIWD